VKTLRKVEFIFDRILDVFGLLAGMVLIAIMTAVSVKVVFRYLLMARLIGVDEIAEIALLYITFLGSAWLLKREGHVSIDLLFMRLEPKTQAKLTVITSLLGAVVSLVFVFYGAWATIDAWSRSIVTPTILELPKAAILAIIPLGSVLLVIQFLRRAWAWSTDKQDVQTKAIG
jgi:TRAP-type C4-dicarboxylate transport system permease small subunit